MRIVRNLIVVVIGAMALGTGGANAEAPHDRAHGSDAAIRSSSDLATPALRRLYNRLEAGYQANDLAAVEGAVARLDPVLTALSRSGSDAQRTDVSAEAARAAQLNDRLAAELAALKANQNGSASGEKLLGGLGGLLTALLSILLGLLSSLGG